MHLLPKLLVLAFACHLISAKNDKLIIKQMPAYFLYDNPQDTSLKLSEFKNLILATSGVSVKKGIKWSGLKSKDSKMIPKATFLFLTNSASMSGLYSSSINISIIEDVSPDFAYLKHSLSGINRVSNLFTNQLTDAELTSNLETECSKDSIINVFDEYELHGSDLSDKIDSIVGKYVTLCSADVQNDLLVYVLGTSEKVKVVKKRAAPVNVIKTFAVFYSDQYPAMFNLIFWTSLILVVALIGIIYGMMSMDPGLDTVIYRMTSNRIKKDN